MTSRAYLDKRFAKDPSIVSRKIAEEFILVPIKQKAGEVESIYTMNNVAGRIWELLDGNKNLREIKDTIVEEFEVSDEVAETDLMGFLQQLEKIGAVKVI